MHYIRLFVIALLLIGIATSSLGQAGQVVDRPIPIGARIPNYPPVARQQRISGVVLVDVKVNAEGNVIEAEPIVGIEVLRVAAKAASLLWRFKPFASPHSPYTVRLTFIFHDVSYVAPKEKPDYRSPYQIEIPYPTLTLDCFPSDGCP